MNTCNPPANGFILSRKPLVTEPVIRSLLSRLKQKDDTAKKPIIDFIHHRLNRRYIQPLLHIQKGYKSGFLMMAASCLLIEALQSFYEGKNNTRGRGISEKSFIDFFKRNKKFFQGFAGCFPMEVVVNNKGKRIETCTFYKNIRCGLLHQAETTGGYSIVRDETPLFCSDKNRKSINADKFVEKLKCCLDEYIKNLHESEISNAPWPMALKKIGHICDNCKNNTP
jgi:hypothetical protein